jgi:hypothetical protein
MGKRIIEVPLDAEQVVLVEVDDEDFYQGADALAPVANVARCSPGRGVGALGDGQRDHADQAHHLRLTRRRRPPGPPRWPPGGRTASQDE